MGNRLSVIIIVIICWLPKITLALEPVRVVVLPFDVYSRENLTYLKTEIPKLIKGELKQEGAILLEPPIAADVSWRTKVQGTAGIRNIGVKTGADFVIWGSMTRIGQKFSLDARMVAPFEETAPAVFYLEGKGIESLIGKVKELTRNLTMKLFKREKIAKVMVTGNKRIETDAIKRMIKTIPGDMFIPKNLTRDLKSIYSMGYFEDIRIESEDSPAGKIVIFNIKEKQTIRNIEITGNKAYKKDEIKENLTLKTGSILNVFQIQNNIQRIEELYKEKNYHNAKITYKLKELDHNQADVEFDIEEGAKVRIKKISFIGNTAFSEKELKKIMKTSEKGFLSWLTSSGELSKEVLNQDGAKVAAYYQNRGYIQTKVGAPQIDTKENWIYITLKIDEGPRFQVGTVDVAGDLVQTKPELISTLKIAKEKFYNRETLRNDVLTLTDLYSDQGYAYANIAPRIDKDFDKLIVDIVFEIKKGNQAYFEKIIIGGNSKTRDKVIRRELSVYEQELYSGQRLKRGVRNLYRLDFFEDVKVNTLKGSADDKMILKIDVKEKPTGAFSFGGGYSSVEDAFFVASVSQRNLFGRGQKMNLNAHIGGLSTRYTLSFTEPWLFDIPLSAGGDIFNWVRDYETYEKDSVGGALRLGYPIYDYTTAFLSYRLARSDIRNITSDAANSIKELAGINIESTISTSVRYDSKDRAFNPTKGSDHDIDFTFAGLGGDIGYTKIVGNTGWYIPLFWETVGFVHGKGGWVREATNKILPDWDKFYLGGINSLRGYDFRDISLIDENGAKVGGEKFIQFNFEYIFPLVKKAGLSGVVFFDTGDVYASNEDIDFDLYQSFGAGVRWFSPIGPIRIEYGYPINPDPGMRDTGRWEFAMGGSFW